MGIDIMDIYSPPGTRVVFAYPKNGYLPEQKLASENLIVGRTYTVRDTHIGRNHTKVQLEELPTMWFNSVQFENEDEEYDSTNTE